MLLAVEREMAAGGHRTTVAACDGSQVNGQLLATGPPADGPDRYDQREREHSAAILYYLRQHPNEFDLIHDQSGSFLRHAGECPVPVLATLHLPRSFYREDQFRDLPRNLYFNCVSHSQASSFADLPNFLGVVTNGIAVEDFPFTASKGNYLLWLGRICEEKAPHLAIQASQSAKMPLVLAGQIYPFQYHQDYFKREIRPQLARGTHVRFVDTPLREQKLNLLRHARALLLTSTAEETSSLVAMEAMACGTPAIAFRRGAFPEVVADGETGFIADSIEEMAAAIADVHLISAQACRDRVEHRFAASRMAREYGELYDRMIAGAHRRAA